MLHTVAFNHRYEEWLVLWTGGDDTGLLMHAS
ncbi:MAG: hypothetical protein KatS3mg114_1103 [Planctomycetaceae bacterium]|nr:MAG: hypothetical protein KatS3mg114_1103 [Planctomycetaceae bacterium]